MMTKLAYFEGRIVPIAEANVSIRCNTLHHGTGCFGGLRAYWNEEHKQLYAFRLLDHYRRFLDSARLLLCEFEYTPEQLRDITLDLLRREDWREDVYIRPLMRAFPQPRPIWEGAKATKALRRSEGFGP